MKPQDVRGLDAKGLTARLGELRQEYASAQEEVAGGKEKNHTRLRQLRRDIARVQTVIREREQTPAANQ